MAPNPKGRLRNGAGSRVSFWPRPFRREPEQVLSLPICFSLFICSIPLSNCRPSSAHKFTAQAMATTSHSILCPTTQVLRGRHLSGVTVCLCLSLSHSFCLGLKWITGLSSPKLSLKIVNCQKYSLTDFRKTYNKIFMLSIRMKW